jgi:curved DNA-binding protein CbpA
MSDDRDLYKILHVDPAADPDVITAAFRALARKLHPDYDATGVHEYRMSELTHAYKVLGDPVTRRAYDERRKPQLTPVGPGESEEPFAEELPSHLAYRWSAHDTDGAAEVRLDFGRYEGQTLREVAKYDPDYLRWLSRHSSGIRYRGAIARVLDRRVVNPYSGRSSP